MPRTADLPVTVNAAVTHHLKPDPIVVAMKPFTGARGALALAQWLAVREGRPLHVLSVLDPFEGASTQPDVTLVAPRYVEETHSKIASRIFESLQHSAYGRLETRVEVVDGAVAQTVDRIARERHASLLVIGTGRLGGLRHGQLAQQVLRLARVPVLLVPPEVEAKPLRHAMAAVDFSAASVRAAAHVLPLLADGSTLTLCHVRAPSPERARDADMSESAYVSQCEESFGRMMRALPVPTGVTVNTKLLHGDPTARLNECMGEIGADILVCGRRNERATARLLLGSVSSGLVRQSRVPVLVMPDAAEDEVGVVVPELPRALPIRDWVALLHDFTRRLRGTRLRVELNGTLPFDPCLVTQDYELVDISYEPDGSRVSLTLGDPRTVYGQLSLWIPEVRSIALVRDISGAGWKLHVDGPDGRAELRAADDTAA